MSTEPGDDGDDVPTSYEEYTVYVDSTYNDTFREFCRAHADWIEMSWKDTHEV